MEGVTALVMTDRVGKAKFSQESVKKTSDELTDTAIHTVCQDTHSNNTCACACTHTHKHTYMGIKGGMEFFKRGLLSGSDKRVEPL